MRVTIVIVAVTAIQVTHQIRVAGEFASHKVVLLVSEIHRVRSLVIDAHRLKSSGVLRLTDQQLIGAVTVAQATTGQ